MAFNARFPSSDSIVYDLGTAKGREAVQAMRSGAAEVGSRAGLDGDDSGEGTATVAQARARRDRDAIMASIRDMNRDIEAAEAEALTLLAALKKDQEQTHRAIDGLRTRVNELDEQITDSEKQRDETTRELEGAKTAQIELETQLSDKQLKLEKLREQTEKREQEFNESESQLRSAKNNYAIITEDFGTPSVPPPTLSNKNYGITGAEPSGPDFVGEIPSGERVLVYRGEDGKYYGIKDISTMVEGESVFMIAEPELIDNPDKIKGVEESGKQVLSEQEARTILQSKIDAQAALSKAYREQYAELFDIEDLEETIQKSQKQISALEQELETVKERIAELEISRSLVLDEVDALEKRSKELSALIDQTEKHIKEIQDFKNSVGNGKLDPKTEQYLRSQRETILNNQESLSANIKAILGVDQEDTAPKTNNQRTPARKKEPAKPKVTTQTGELSAEERTLLFNQTMQNLHPILGAFLMLAVLFSGEDGLDFIQQFMDGDVNFTDIFRSFGAEEAGRRIAGRVDHDRVEQAMGVKIPKTYNGDREIYEGIKGSLLNIIKKYESYGGDYNTLNGGAQPTYNGKLVSEMTIAQVYEVQAQWRKYGAASSAIGAYQVINDTLRGAVKGLGLDLETTVFDVETQDRIAMYLLEQRGLSAYLNGRISAERFMHNIGHEWASLPINRHGHAAYGGVANNPATVSQQRVTEIGRALEILRVAHQRGHDKLAAAGGGKPEEEVASAKLAGASDKVSKDFGKAAANPETHDPKLTAERDTAATPSQTGSLPT